MSATHDLLEQPPGRRPAASVLWAALAAAALSALLHLPFLGTPELSAEEGRRAWPAREMLASGDFVVPTIYGETYLAKPPLYYWSIAAAARTLDRPVDAFTTRLPAALSTILTAAAVALVAGSLGGACAAWFAGLAFPVMLGVLEKGAYGELEATLGMFTFLAMAAILLGRGRRGASGVGWGILGGLALGAAFLTKGPPALLFFIAAVAGASRAGDAPRAWRRSTPWWALGLGLAIVGAWVGLLHADPRGAEALATWRAETVGRGGRDLAGLVRERQHFVTGFLGATFPIGWIVLATFGTGTRRILRRTSPGWNASLVILAIGVTLVLLAPGPRPRYAYPLLPWCAVAGGLALASAFEQRARGAADRGFERRLWLPLAPIALAGLVLAVGGATLMFRPIAGMGPLSPIGLGIAILGGGSGVWLVRCALRKQWLAAMIAALAVLVCLRLLERGEYGRQRGEWRGRREAAAEVTAAIPPGATLHVVPWKFFNALFYVERPLRRAAKPETLPPGSWIVSEGPLEDPTRFETLRTVRARAGDTLTISVRTDAD